MQATLSDRQRRNTGRAELAEGALGRLSHRKRLVGAMNPECLATHAFLKQSREQSVEHLGRTSFAG
jgi:hypothetical protein